jgi:3-oxoacyl-[acyl-carrier protein] reductase
MASNDLLSLRGKTALITGGASGMGKAASTLFAAHGAHVVIADRNGELGAQTAAEIDASGGSADSFTLDVGEPDAVAAFVEALPYEVLDVFFNHAGLPGPPGFDFDVDSWTNAMMVNVWAPMELTKQLLPRLRRSPAASLIYTASTAGLRPVPHLLTYAASKAALIQFVKSLAILVAPEGMRANVICPGATDTPALRRDLSDGTLHTTLEAIASSIPMRRLGTPEDIANVALFLASDASAYVTGLAFPVEGGAAV